MIRGYLFILCLVIGFGCSLSYAQSGETDLLAAAQQAFNDGFSDTAKRYLEDFVLKYPQSQKIFTAKLLLGECDFLRGDYQGALHLFEELSEHSDHKDQILYWRAETYLKQNRFVDAQKDYQKVIADFPQSSYAPQAYYSLGWSFFQMKAFDQAKSIFKRLIAGYAQHALAEDAHLKIAECDYNAGHLKDALEDFKQFIDIYPQSSHLCAVYYNSAESLYALDRFDEAQKFYHKALTYPCAEDLKCAVYTADGWNAVKLGQWRQAQDSFKRAGRLSKVNGFSLQEIVLGQAQLAYGQGLYDQALLLFTDFINHYPQSLHWTQGYLGRANVLYLLKRYAQARLDYAHVSRQADSEIFEKCRFGLGWCALKLGHISEAIGYFQEVFDASTQAKTRVQALIQMADVYQESYQWDNAAAIYERVKKVYPDNDMNDYVLYRQGIVFLKLDKMDAALDDFRTLRHDFTHSRYWDDLDYYMGIIAFKKADWQTSRAMMGRYLKHLLRPSEFACEANYVLALAQLNLKEPEEALTVFQKILRLYPNDTRIAPNADMGIAKCQFQLGQEKEALRRFKLIVYKYPKTDTAFEALLALAQYYLKNANSEAAIEYYRLIIDTFPHLPAIDQMHYELGQAYELQGRFDEALLQYRSMVGRDIALAGKTKLAIAGIMAKDMEPQKAIVAYETIIAMGSEDANEAYLKLGQLYRNMQDYEKELRVYQRALVSKAAHIDLARMQFNVADTLELMSRTEEAIAEYLKLLDIYPREYLWGIKAYLRVAKIYEEGEDWQGARVIYQKIIQLNVPESAYAQERLDWIKNNAGKVRVL